MESSNQGAGLAAAEWATYTDPKEKGPRAIEIHLHSTHAQKCLFTPNIEHTEIRGGHNFISRNPTSSSTPRLASLKSSTRKDLNAD